MTDQIYCPIRKSWVAALPEEIIRQRLISYMVRDLFFPPAYLVVEQGLHQLPHLALKDHKKTPKRRIDLLCYGKDIHPSHSLYPLLIVECKAVPLTDKVLNQVAGYNHFLQSYFIAVANEQEIRTGWYDPQKSSYQFINTLPTFNDLLAMIGHRSPPSPQASRERM